MQVEWRVHEEEEEAEGQPFGAPPDDGPSRTRRNRPWWLTSLFALLLLAAVAWSVRFVIQRQLEAVSSAAEAELLAIHDIVQRAERTGDETLFGSMISPEYPNWGAIQKRLFRNDQRWDRSFLNLFLADSDQAPVGTVTDIEFTSDWRMATVTLAFPYQRADGSPVSLLQTVTYREESVGWALVPAYPAFWGETRTKEGKYLTVSYPERDAALVERLVQEWDDLLATVCEDLDGLTCRNPWKLTIELSTESTVLSLMADPIRWLDGEGALRLPTPSMVGRPVDEAGYAALRDGYAPLVASAGIVRIVGWDCCEKTVFLRALLDKQLSELGIAPWPMTPDTYAEMLQGPIIDVANLHRVYLQRSIRNVAPRTRLAVYSVIDFILATWPEQTPGSILRALNRSNTYRSWLGQAGVEDFGRQMQREWIRYANGQLAAHAEIGSLPEQDIQLLCVTERFRNTDVYRLDLASGTFIPELVNRSFRLMYPLPDDGGVLLQDRNVPVRGSQVQLYRQGAVQDVLYQAYNGPLFPVMTAGDEMLFYSYDSRQQLVLFNRLKLADCEAGDCAMQFFDGYPVWSPNRERSVVTRGTGVLWLGDADGSPNAVIGRGTSVAWLDNDRFAYVQQEAEPMQVDAVTLPTLEIETLLDADTLIYALPLEIDVERMFISALARHESRPEQLVVAARVQRMGRTEADEFHIFSFDLDKGKATYLMQVDHSLEPFNPMQFSPDGRWLQIRSLERGNGGWNLNLYDTETGKSLVYSTDFPLAYPGYDWSADGQWLVRVDDGFLHLIAPNEGVQRLIVHDFSSCYSAAWVNPKE